MQQEVFEIIARFTGQANLLVVPRMFIDYTGDHVTALLLSQCVYWTDRTKDPEGWFYKTQEEWKEEIGVSRYQLDRSVAKLKTMGILETALRKVGGAPTVHYRVDKRGFDKSICEFLANPIARNQQIELLETSKSNCEKPTNPLTETTSINYAETTSNGVAPINLAIDRKAQAAARLMTEKPEPTLDEKIARIRDAADHNPSGNTAAWFEQQYVRALGNLPDIKSYAAANKALRPLVQRFGAVEVAARLARFFADANRARYGYEYPEFVQHFGRYAFVPLSGNNGNHYTNGSRRDPADMAKSTMEFVRQHFPDMPDNKRGA